MNLLYTTVFLLNSVLFSVAETKNEKTAFLSNKKPLVLEWEVSHPRNTDQITLIFRQKSVELATNTSSYQKGKVAKLGRFESPLNFKLKALKEQVERYYIQLRKTVPVSSLIKDSRFYSEVEPHAPVLRINEEKIKNRQTYFKPLASIIYKIWENEWTCLECAIYKKNRKFIIRTVKTLKSGSNRKAEDQEKSQNKEKQQWETKIQKFSKKQLRCVSKEKDRIECIDPKFGIFEI